MFKQVYIRFLFILLSLSLLLGCSLKADKVYFENLETQFPLTKGVYTYEKNY